MLRNLLHSKIHQARLTGCFLEYEGSIEVDEDLMDAAGMVSYEKVLIANMNNGTRLETYLIPGERGKGSIALNGAAAHHGMPGDRVIIISFCSLNEAEQKTHRPRVIRLDENNRIVQQNISTSLQ